VRHVNSRMLVNTWAELESKMRINAVKIVVVMSSFDSVMPPDCLIR
jgi:hypothetical protein